MATEEGSTAGTAVASPQDTCTLCIKESMVTNKFRKRLLVAALEDNLRTHMERKYGWTAETFNLIDWDHLGYAIERSYHKSKHSYTRTMKFQFDIQNTGYQKKRYSKNCQHTPTASDQCPCCRTEVETTMHLFQCKDAALVSIRIADINDLEDLLQKRHMPPDLWLAMKEGILRYTSGSASVGFIPSSVRALRAYSQQTQIGWDHFFKGRIACAWGSVMADIYATSGEIGYSESHRRFVLTLIEHLWKMYANLWIKRSEKLHDDTDINALTTEELNRRMQFFLTSANLFSIVEIKIGSIWDCSIHYGWITNASRTKIFTLDQKRPKTQMQRTR